METVELAGMLVSCVSMLRLGVDVYSNFHQHTHDVSMHAWFFMAVVFKVGRIFIQGEFRSCRIAIGARNYQEFHPPHTHTHTHIQTRACGNCGFTTPIGAGAQDTDYADNGVQHLPPHSGCVPGTVQPRPILALADTDYGGRVISYLPVCQNLLLW